MSARRPARGAEAAAAAAAHGRRLRGAGRLFVALVLALLAGPLALAGRAAAAGPVVAASVRWVLTVQPGGLAVLEMVTVANAGGSATAAWSWRLPPGARAATLQPGGAAARLGGGALADARPLAPGEQRSYALRYELPYKVPARLAFTPSLPVESASALVDEGSLRLAGPGWVRLGVVAVGGRALRQYALERPLAAGQRLELLLTPPDWWYEHGTGALAAAWALLLAGVPALAFWLWRRSRPEAELERVRRALERVERLHEAGRLQEAPYRIRRQQLVDEAAQLLAEVDGSSREAG
ncbi:MAG: hypothetical protein QJR08_08755 [Bacillota bacterium]|nr:hypothetical protein [Bacillota bacterium]